ncbi:hypothetical protein AO398_11575 [Methylobacterium sp. GXS13]|jgi:hypothetical protein|uniref:hypothetical protein n=1 Tax=Methylobacterium sp. GXS13 TaxID=1730094 RepID=UPI00071BA14F|nr:hypothetical protein [Methylobacterium sp. GXS13]KST60944.1 hypothetical protein AO398_11575 [Methylobacterium sp. GXS13]
MSDDNVIRPTFGTPRNAAPPERTDPDADAELPPLRLFGAAAGHRVGLIRDTAAQEGDVFRIVVGPEDEQAVETVALLPAGADTEGEAERIGFAILRALEVIEGAV